MVACQILVVSLFVIEASEYWRKPEWLKKLMALQEELLGINVSVHLAWIPGHSGICANETADQLAKQMAQDIVRGRITAPSHISIQSALRLSSEIAYNSWQQKNGSVIALVFTQNSFFHKFVPKSHFRTIVIPACPTAECCSTIHC